jgi:hypothetical protein
MHIINLNVIDFFRKVHQATIGHYILLFVLTILLLRFHLLNAIFAALATHFPVRFILMYLTRHRSSAFVK